MKVKLLILAAVLILVACRSSSKNDEEQTLQSAGDKGIPVEVYLRVNPAESHGLPAFSEVEKILTPCLECHGRGKSPDYSQFPFSSRFLTQKELLAETLKRLRDNNSPMPPPPKTRLSNGGIATLEEWGRYMNASPAQSLGARLFTGLVVRITIKDSSGELRDVLLPWQEDGILRGELPGVVPGPAIGGELAVLGEDGEAVVTKDNLSFDTTKLVVIDLLIDEASIRSHLLDSSQPVPGDSGVLLASGVGLDSFDLTWTAAQDDLTPPPSLTYAVYINDKELNELAAVEKLTPTARQKDLTAYKVRNLSSGAIYYAYVVAEDEAGNKSLYKGLAVKTLSDVTPPVVPNKTLSLGAVTNTSLQLSWQSATDNKTTTAKMRYVVYASYEGGLATLAQLDANGVAASEPRLGTSAQVFGLVPGVTYQINVVAVDEGSNRTIYAPVTFTTVDQESSDDIVGYGEDCAERLGYIKAFSCFDGGMIPVTIEGEAIKPNLTPEEATSYNFGTGASLQKCDRPAVLQLGKQGECIPYSRLVRLQSYKTDGSVMPHVDVVATCRRYVARLGVQNWDGQSMDGSLYPGFEDIAMIQHNRITGETCFYQAYNTSTSVDGRRVPPPTEVTVPGGAPSYAKPARQFWRTPSYAASFKCVRCHDSDPWIHSPYVDQVKGADGNPLVPSAEKDRGWSGRYSALGNRGFQGWPAAKTVTSTNNALCTTCHNIGDQKTCQDRVEQFTGRQFARSVSDYAQGVFALKIAMPPHDPEIPDEAAWHAAGYGDATDEMLRCCNDPSAQGCESKALFTYPPPYLK